MQQLSVVYEWMLPSGELVVISKTCGCGYDNKLFQGQRALHMEGKMDAF